MRWPLQTASVRGPSMVPALRHGDALLTWRGWRRSPGVRAGDVVLARFRTRPDLLVVKRAVRRTGGGWWLAGDNPYGSDDSESYGPAQVEARVVWRYWPLSRFGPVRGPLHSGNGGRSAVD
ncbi:MAG: S26 family signal peptidase [Micromonosporaceae bacterium]